VTTSDRRSLLRAAADGSLLVLQVGAEGGSLTLVGRNAEGRAWQFARITDDQTEALFGDTGDGTVKAPSFENLGWVDTWEEGLRLMDRYPWARLHPLYVHPEFVERVQVAVEERLAEADAHRAGYARERWEEVFDRVRSGE
jgi:hypothetical protein